MSAESVDTRLTSVEMRLGKVEERLISLDVDVRVIKVLIGTMASKEDLAHLKGDLHKELNSQTKQFVVSISIIVGVALAIMKFFGVNP